MDFNVTDFNVRLRTIKIRELVLAIVIAFILTVILSLIFPIIEVYDDLLLICLLFFLFAFFIYALKGTTGLKEDFNKLFERENRREILYVMIINLLFAFIIVALFSSLDTFLGFVDPEWTSVLDFTPTAVDPVVFLFESFTAIIVAPIIEELVFRGILFNRFKIRIGIIPAMILSSFLFAIGHEFGGMISAFVFGMCMCVIYLKTDNILMSMSIHFLNNLLATIMDLMAIDAFVFKMPILPITLLISIVSGLLIIIYLYQEIKKIREVS